MFKPVTIEEQEERAQSIVRVHANIVSPTERFLEALSTYWRFLTPSGFRRPVFTVPLPVEPSRGGLAAPGRALTPRPPLPIPGEGELWNGGDARSQRKNIMIFACTPLCEQEGMQHVDDE